MWDNKKFMDQQDRANIFETADGIFVIDHTYKNETLTDGETYYMIPEMIQIFAFNNLNKKPAKPVDSSLYNSRYRTITSTNASISRCYFAVKARSFLYWLG